MQRRLRRVVAATRTTTTTAWQLRVSRCIAGSTAASSAAASSRTHNDDVDTAGKNDNDNNGDKHKSVSSARDVADDTVLSPFRPFVATREVRSEHILSARAVAQLLPSSRTLRAQLPSARALKDKYMRNRTTTTTTTTAAAATTAADDDDGDAARSTPVEDVLFGEDATVARDATRQGLQLQHVLLASRALWWGTLYALVGVAAVVCIALVSCGCYSVADVQQLVRARMPRRHKPDNDHVDDNDDDAATRTQGDSGSNDAHYVVDFGNGSGEAWQQIVQVWRAVQAAAEAEAAAASVDGQMTTTTTTSA